MTLVKMNKQPLVLKKSLYFLDQGHALSWWKHIHTRRATERQRELVHLLFCDAGLSRSWERRGSQAVEKGLLGKFFLYFIFIFFPPRGLDRVEA